VGMGILPLQFTQGATIDSLGLTGRETFDVQGLGRAIATGFSSGRELSVRAVREDGTAVDFTALIRIDTPQEVLYYRHGGILQYVLRQLLHGREKPEALSGGLATAPEIRRDPNSGVDEGSAESFPASDPPTH